MKKLLIIVLLIVGCEEILEPEDCAGVAGGSAVEDCNEECGGTASIDDCGTCTGGTTELESNYLMDCAGVCYGNMLDNDNDGVCDDWENLTVADIDGNTYSTVQIGYQLWMSENLKTTHYNDGSEIQYVQSEFDEPNVWENLSTGAYGYYNDDPSHLETYGNLYNWYAVDEGDLCMEGWQVPTDDEWTVLTDFIAPEGIESWGNSVAGGKMKEEGLDHWISPNAGATNESGFSAFPAGYRGSSNGNYFNMGGSGYFWSTSEYDSSNAWYRLLYCGSSGVDRNYHYKPYGFSIRCLRD